jgi:hypothetical protein
VLIVADDADCDVYIALRIEGIARPMFSSGWFEVEDKPVADLFVLGPGPDCAS